MNRDQELEEYLQGDSELSKRYQQGKELQPPASLDRAILAAAKAAVADERGKRKGWLARFLDSDWLTPVSSFAMITLMAIAVYMLIVPDPSTSTGLRPAADMAGKKPVPADTATTEVPKQTLPVKSTSTLTDTGKIDHKTLEHVTHQTPKAWLEHIDKLYQNHKTGLAKAEYRRFKQTYPTYPARSVLGSKVLQLEAINGPSKAKTRARRKEE